MIKRLGDACSVLCPGSPCAGFGDRSPAQGPGRGLGWSLTGAEPAFCWRTYREKPTTLREDTKIEFITDVEGSWDYFLRFIAVSHILYWQDDERGVWGPGTLMIRDNCVLVFGGDTSDKGPGDIRFVKTLLSLKHRFPDRVEMILGNRDINKLRFWSELAEGQDPTQFFAYWDKTATTFQAFMEQNTGNGLHLGKNVKGPLAYLHWMLNCNMGCQLTSFGNRRLELALINGRVTDEDVVESYRQCANPNGEDPWMLDYLRLGKLALVLKDTVFIHADIPEIALGFVPEKEELVLDSCQKWMDALNAWKDKELEAYRRQPAWVSCSSQEKKALIWSCTADGGRTRGGVGLIDYGTPRGCDGKSVTYNNPFIHGNSQLIKPEVEEVFRKWGVKRIFSGHQPHGQSPTVVRHPKTGLLRITADTSYSNMQSTKIFNKSDNRGEVVNVVQVQGDKTLIWGTIMECKHYTLLNSDQEQDELPHALVGRQLNNGAWIKGVIVPEASAKNAATVRKSKLKVCKGLGFKIDMTTESETHCCMMMKPEFKLRKFNRNTNYQNLRGSQLARSKSCLEDAPDPDDSLTRSKSRRQWASILDDCDTFLFAPQGVIYNCHDPTGNLSATELKKKVVEKINELITRERVLFVSNNSRESRREIAINLEKCGIRFTEEPERSIISSAFTCAWFLKQAEVKRPFVLSSHRGLLDELESVGINNYVATIYADGSAKPEYLQRIEDQNTIMDLVDADVDCVVAGWDQQVTTLKIGVAAMYLRLNPNMKIVTCSMDPSGVFGVYDPETPSPARQKYKKQMVYAVGNGVIANSVCLAAGRDAKDAINVGKPSVIMLDHLRDKKSYDFDLSKAVMIGDTVPTDMHLADAGGMKSVLVLSGVTSLEDYDALPLDQHAKISVAIATFADL